MLKKIFLIALTSVLALCVFAGCGVSGCGNKFNAILYDNAEELISEEFKNENRIKWAFYDDDIDYDSYPTTRTFIVDSRDKYEQIFVNDLTDLEVDFDKEMLIVYTFATEYHRTNNIKDIDLKDYVLTIKFKMESKSGVGDASQPYQRWFVVKMDKLEITAVEFVEQR